MSKSAPSTTTELPFPRRSIRVIVSLLVLWHLAAVIGRPWEFATQGPYGTSPSASTFYQAVDGYSQFMYLDHGYAFFAPDPGPSHYFIAEVQPATGEKQQLKFPDLAQQWPRLLYHRHFMLAEFLHNVYHPVDEPPAEIAGDAMARTAWLRERQRYLDVKQSLTNHLVSRYPDAAIEITRGEHRQPGLPEFLREQLDIRDPRLMIPLLDSAAPSTAPSTATGLSESLAPMGQATDYGAQQSRSPSLDQRPEVPANGPELIENPIGEPVK